MQVKNTKKDAPAGILPRYRGVFLKKYLGALAPQGDDTKEQEKGTHLSNAGRCKKTKKKGLSHAHSKNKAAAGVGNVATPQHRQGTHQR